MAKVFVISRSGHDFTPAEKHGQLVFLTEGAIGKFNTGTMYRAAYRKLKHSEPTDFMLVTGQGILNAVACGMFAAIHGRLNLLLYNGTENRYIVRRIVYDSPGDAD